MSDILFTTVNLPSAYVGVAYEAAIAYKGAATPVTAQSIVQTGALSGVPTGLALDAVGAAPGSLRLAGTPTGAVSAGATPLTGPGNYTFQISATDTAGAVTSATYTIPLFSPAFTTVTLPPAFLGFPYEASLSCGNSGAGSWVLASSPASGDTGIPPGLSIVASDSRITGTPLGTKSTPNGSGVAQQGAGFTYTFTLSNGSTTARFSINLWSSPTDPYYHANVANAQRMALLSGIDQ